MYAPLAFRLIFVMSPVTGARMKAANRRIRILIADDHSLIRKRVRSTLEEHPRFEVCGEATDGAKAIEAAQKLKPDVVVLNVTMPVLSGFEAAREIRATVPESAIVILSSHADRRFIDEAKRIGARAYVAKTEVGKALVKAIEAALVSDDFVLLD
ncbi:MAG TPA: response regulator transcription factor [Candidatus Acidoferrales bacterium]|nr:response regulator transcription factor [Candidatus Acidoferrales bacterium]